MWPLLIRTLRVYAPYITLPFAALVGVIGYNIENLLSDKYTPYNKSIEQQRVERLTSDESLQSAVNVKQMQYERNILKKNAAPSLQD